MLTSIAVHPKYTNGPLLRNPCKPITTLLQTASQAGATLHIGLHQIPEYF